MCSPSAATNPPLKSRSNKRRRTTATIRRWIITSFPFGLLVEILSDVVSKSVNDLFKVKATCKLLFEFGFERHVMKNATIYDKFCRRGCIEQRRADYSRFMAECVDSENPKALFCLGIKDYFYVGRDEGIRNLRFMAEKGMKAAKYACAILSLLAGGDMVKEESLRFLESVRKADDVREYRNMVKFVMENNMWVNAIEGQS